MDLPPIELFRTFGLAILLGALLGLERERAGARIAGMRTFPLVALFGAVSAFLGALTTSPWMLAVGLGGVAAFAVMGNLLQDRREKDPGLTTEVSLLIAFAAGALTFYKQSLLAVTVAFATTAILYFKPHLHAFSRKVEQRDIYAIFQFGLVTFIILPLLPDRSLGPFDAINPHHIWLMVVLISGLSLAGYVVLKMVGVRWGGPVLGLLGGMVSSTATTLAFSRHARANEKFSRTAAVVVVLASTVVLVRVALEVAVINRGLLKDLAVPIGLMFATGVVMAAVVWREARSEEAPVPEAKNPAELRSAIAFGLLYGVVLMAVSAGKHYFGNQGVYVVSLVSGLTDVDAITLTSARLAGTGVLTAEQARNAILIAVLSNMGFKLAAVRMIGTRALARWTALAFVPIAAIGIGVLLL